MRRKITRGVLNVAIVLTLVLLIVWVSELMSKLNKLIMDDNPLGGLVCTFCLLCIPLWLAFIGLVKKGDLDD